MLSRILDAKNEILYSDNRLDETLYNEVSDEEANNMKGYLVSGGYMGLVEGEYMLFASESDYQEYMEEI